MEDTAIERISCFQKFLQQFDSKWAGLIIDLISVGLQSYEIYNYSQRSDYNDCREYKQYNLSEKNYFGGRNSYLAREILDEIQLDYYGCYKYEFNIGVVSFQTLIILLSFQSFFSLLKVKYHKNLELFINYWIVSFQFSFFSALFYVSNMECDEICAKQNDDNSNLISWIARISFLVGISGIIILLFISGIKRIIICVFCKQQNYLLNNNNKTMIFIYNAFKLIFLFFVEVGLEIISYSYSNIFGKDYYYIIQFSLILLQGLYFFYRELRKLVNNQDENNNNKKNNE